MFDTTMATVLDLAEFGLLAGSAAAALLCLLIWRSRRTRRPISFGVSLALFFATTALMTDRLLPLGLPTEVHLGASRTLGALACLAVAFALDAALRRFVWFGSLREGDRSAVPAILIGLASLGIYAVTVMVSAAQIFHYDITAVAATSGVLAVVLGYSAQPTLSEIFAGLALNISRPFRIGDSVQVDGVWGVVVESGWRSVGLRTYEGTLVTLPNSKAASLRLTNLDLPDHTMRHHIPIVVDIDVPPGRVREVGLAAMLGVASVLRTPAPMLLFKTVTEQGMAYEAIFWHASPSVYLLCRDEVGTALWYAFHRAGIPFAVQRRLQARAGDATAPVAPVDARAQRAQLREILHRSALYQAFPADAVDTLVDGHALQLYGRGERVIRQGEAGHSMFVILEGAVDVLLEDGASAEQRIYGLGVGDTFGHMSLMTGATRFATVRATGHLVVAEIGTAALAPILRAHPAAIDIVAQEILRIESSREALLQAGLTDSADAVDDRRGLLDQLADRIRGFFLPAAS